MYFIYPLDEFHYQITLNLILFCRRTQLEHSYYFIHIPLLHISSKEKKNFVYHAITKMKRKKEYDEIKFKQKSRMTLSSPPRSEETCSTAGIPFIHCEIVRRNGNIFSCTNDLANRIHN